MAFPPLVRCSSGPFRFHGLAQFELLPNYRFHRYVTGRSAIEAALPFGNGRTASQSPQPKPMPRMLPPGPCDQGVVDLRCISTWTDSFS
jgi:hypothetical protein